MKFERYLNLKEYVWNSVKKLFNSHSRLIVDNLNNGCIKCCWQISKIDEFRIEMSKSCFWAIRLFDITNNRNINSSTCIMKEVQVSKFQSSIAFPVPINKGVYYFELGYRKKNGEWRKIANYYLNLGYRIKKLLKSNENDNWFDSKKGFIKNNLSIHEKAYQISLQPLIGGSENTAYEQEIN